jgi:hypothetical protein
VKSGGQSIRDKDFDLIAAESEADIFGLRQNPKNCVFWDVTLCGTCKNQRFGGAYHSSSTPVGTQEHFDHYQAEISDSYITLRIWI